VLLGGGIIENDEAWYEGAQLKERRLSKIFEDLEGEIALMAANAKFIYNIRKSNETELKIIVAYIEDTKTLFKILKTRMTLLSEATS
jgi:hypothetical protein